MSGLEYFLMFDGILNFLSMDGLSPHVYSLMYRSDLVWIHVISDSLIALSYFSIPLAIIYFTVRRKDFKFKQLLILSSSFIILSCLTHILNIWTLWVPVYWLEGLVKLATAIVSMVTAVFVWKLLPKALALPSLDEIMRREQQIRASEERYRSLVDNQSDMVLRLDVNGHISFVNATTAIAFGNSREKLVGMPWQSFIHDDDQPRVLKAIHSAFQSADQFVVVEARTLTSRGERWVSWEGKVLPFAENALPEIQASGRDITDRVYLLTPRCGTMRRLVATPLRGSGG